MPPLPGEERLLTVFADIHYYFTVPTPKPLHHRFDKGSYLYIYHDDADNKARIEIANNPGTSDQDAFHGGLENVHIRHSTQFPTQCTLTVDGLGSPHQPAHYEWRLPSGDPRNERHSLLRLHTLDIYFWTLDDANQFLDIVGRVLTTHQLETDRPAPSEQPMSSVVQQLENVAVTDPAYQNGQTPNSRSEMPSVTAPATQGIQQVPSFPPPPPGGPIVEQQQSSSVQQSPVVEQQKTPESFAPLPYNPAAPAAPEPIKHREKTPPPEDGADGTGLAAAVAADHGVPYTPPSQAGGAVGMAALTNPQTPQGNSYMGGQAAYASPPPSAGLTNPATFSQRGSIQSPGVPSYQQQQAFQPGGQQWAPNTPGSMTFAPPPQDPNAHLYAQQQAQQQAQQVYGSPQSPPHQQNKAVQIAGYSNFSYDKSQQPQQQAQPGASEYDVHNQLYRPTETEANSHVYQHAQKSTKNTGPRGRKFEDKAEKLESGMNRFFKKLEKKL